MATNGIRQSDARLKLLWWGVIVVAALVYLTRLGGHNLLDPDEGRYAEIPREMIESGDLITPKLNYVDYFEKPPLFYWMVAGSMAVFGRNVSAARLVVGLAGLATILVTMGLGARILDRRTAILSGWIYLTAMVPLGLARLLTIDGPFSLFLASSWAAWYLAFASPPGRAKKGWVTLSWVCLGLATMTKGPVAIVLSGALILAFVILRRDWAALKMTFWLPALAAFAVVAAPWFVAVSMRNPEFAHFFFVVQHIERFTGSAPEHVKPFYFFFPILPAGLGAWALIGIAALVKGARDGYGEAGLFHRSADVGSSDAAPGAVLFLFLWVALVVGFFSASACKLITYILPAYPAFALLTAWYLTRGGLNRLWARVSVAFMAVVLAAGATMLPHYAQHQKDVPVDQIGGILLAAQIAFAIGALLLLASAWKPRMIQVTAGLVLIMILPPLLGAVPVIAKYRRVGVIASALPNPLPADLRVVDYRDYNQSLSFYLQRRTILVDDLDELTFGSTVGDQSAWFLKGEDSLRRLAKEGPLLVVTKQDDWPKVSKLSYLRPVCANSTTVFMGNETFLRATGLKPWPIEAVTEPPRLLMPQRQ